MERDKQLKQILYNSTDGASAGFTDAVIKRVKSFSNTQLTYQPLVNAKLKRLFLLAFGAVSITILALCIILAFSTTYVFDWVQSWEFPDLNYNNVLVFIITFWIVFAANAWVKRKFSLHHESTIRIH